jgi:hypothetical protein
LIAARRITEESDFMYSISVSLMSLKFSSERALEASWTMAGMTTDDLKGRVN